MSAAPRPIVKAEPLIVPRKRRARSDCFSAAFSPRKNPSPASSLLASMVPSDVDLNQPSNPVGSFGENNWEATFCVNSGVKLSAENVQRVAVFSLSYTLRRNQPFGCAGSVRSATLRADKSDAKATVLSDALPFANAKISAGFIHGFCR